jgi:hypothetical protein
MLGAGASIIKGVATSTAKDLIYDAPRVLRDLMTLGEGNVPRLRTGRHGKIRVLLRSHDPEGGVYTPSASGRGARRGMMRFVATLQCSVWRGRVIGTDARFKTHRASGR